MSAMYSVQNKFMHFFRFYFILFYLFIFFFLLIYYFFLFIFYLFIYFFFCGGVSVCFLMKKNQECHGFSFWT